MFANWYFLNQTLDQTCANESTSRAGDICAKNKQKPANWSTRNDQIKALIILKKKLKKNIFAKLNQFKNRFS